ncbi:MAG: NADH-quinone oxidoreductase subunit H [Chloroflexi bacterium]|nr:MAG: NADH-quinone oxidoreductase subunit H [Chloroflexota bacterium]
MTLGDYYATHDFWLGIGMPLHDWLVGLGVPGWLVSLVYVAFGAAVILGMITFFVIIAIWAERRFIARLQDRRGPNRVGKFGLLQSVADALKLLAKEIIRPAQADPTLPFLAPMLILGASLMTWAVIPWGPGLQVANLNIGVLYLLAFGAIPALGVTIAGWGSTNKYSLFGGMRAVVQYVSYEVPAGIVIVVPVLLARTMSLQGIVQAQSGPLWNWFVFQPTFFIGPLPIPFPIIGLVAFVYYLIAGLAETNRTPFDHVEADSELTGGFTTEYSGMQFALFFLAEYANSIAVGLLGSTLFLGGYHTGLGDAFDDLIWPLLPGVLISKAAIIFLIFVWVRGTLPRFRYDQLMQFAWKRMLPVSLALVSLSALFASLSSLLGPIVRLAPGVR